jgi:hypothetical protein
MLKTNIDNTSLSGMPGCGSWSKSGIDFRIDIDDI